MAGPPSRSEFAVEVAELADTDLGVAVEVLESPAGFGRVEVSHYSLNDQVVEGLRALDVPAFSVQYHPEAAAGPHDSMYLFDRFADLVRERRDGEPLDAATADATTPAADITKEAN